MSTSISDSTNRYQWISTFGTRADRPFVLGDYFGKKPVILSLVYYECPMLCTQVLNGQVTSLRDISFNVGEQFNVVTVSFNPRETPALAKAKKEMYLSRYGRPGAEEGWHFLTGDPKAIASLADSVGFHYVYDALLNQYAHASGIMVLTPQGKISRYFYGIDYSPRDLRLGLVEASAGKIGTPVDQIMLLCYHYDAATGKYGVMVTNSLRIGGIIIVLLIVTLFFLLQRRVRRRKSKEDTTWTTASFAVCQSSPCWCRSRPTKLRVCPAKLMRSMRSCWEWPCFSDR